MSLFAHRRLQAMLEGLSGQLSASKQTDLIKRLENKRVEQSLPAQMELALIWAVGQLGNIEVEPDLEGAAGRFDAYSPSFMSGRGAAIEIWSTNDNKLSDEKAMDKVALEISACADKICRGVGDYLYYAFRSEFRYENQELHLYSGVPKDYRITEDTETALREWIAGGHSRQSPLVIKELDLYVVIERRAYKQIRYHNVFSSAPPAANSVKKNPIYNGLKSKLKRLESVPPGSLRLIFLADVGSMLLNRIGERRTASREHYSAERIIVQFVDDNSDRVDAVAVFVPKGSSFGRGAIRWSVWVAEAPGLEGIEESIGEIASYLPPPSLEGYQARSSFRQGSFEPHASGIYDGMSITAWKDGKMEVKISTRALLDLLAGRITFEHFSHAAGVNGPNDKNYFEHWLQMGQTIAAVHFEEGGLDKDEDHIVLHLEDDPAVRRLREVKTEPTGDG